MRLKNNLSLLIEQVKPSLKVYKIKKFLKLDCVIKNFLVK